MRASSLPVSDIGTFLAAKRALNRFCIRTVSDAKASLQRFNFFHERFDHVRYDLKCRFRIARLAEVLRELGLDQDESLTRTFQSTDEEAYASAAFALLGRDTALDTDFMEQDYLDGEELWLRPQMLGLNALWDEEFESNFEEPEEHFHPDDRLIPFLACLNLGFGEEIWDRCNKYFKWRIPKPPVTDGDFDSDIFERMLVDMGLSDFLAACEVAWGGNLFFSMDYQSEPFDLTAENVLMLNEAYADAKETIENSRKCCQKVNRNRGILKMIYAAWRASFVIRERVRV